MKMIERRKFIKGSMGVLAGLVVASVITADAADASAEAWQAAYRKWKACNLRSA